MNPPTAPIDRSADGIAGDLALAIHQGLIRPDERLPTQKALMKSYGVAMGTAASALAKLAAAGLTRGEPGRGTFATNPRRAFTPNPILDVLAASSMCRSLAAMSFGRNTSSPTLEVGGSPDWNTAYETENTMPPRRVDVAALADLDRHVLRWMSEAFLAAARRLVAAGVGDADTHLIASARAILRDGGQRPEGQAPIAISGGPAPADEDVVLRIWPERGDPLDPNGPPF